MRKLAFLVLALPLLFGFADTGGVGEGGDVGFTPPGGGGGGSCSNSLDFSQACNSANLGVIL